MDNVHYRTFYVNTICSVSLMKISILFTFVVVLVKFDSTYENQGPKIEPLSLDLDENNFRIGISR